MIYIVKPIVDADTKAGIVTQGFSIIPVQGVRGQLKKVLLIATLSHWHGKVGEEILRREIRQNFLRKSKCYRIFPKLDIIQSKNFTNY